MKQYFWYTFILMLLLGACTPSEPVEGVLETDEPLITPSIADIEEVDSPVTEVKVTTSPTPNNEVVNTPIATPIPTNTPQTLEQGYSKLPDSSNWEHWPELPVLSEIAIEIYTEGLDNGTDPHAFSVFGDCQSLPDSFWGRYDDPEYEFSGDLSAFKEVAHWYAGSFDRESVTVKKGTTAAAILWAGWLDGDDHPCDYGESPLACELRIHNPSIVIISLGTHWELRNDIYLRKMLDQLIEKGVLPIISTKADHREGEAWVNEEMVSIAQEYQLPVWNFWAAVQSLENQGIIENDPMYMTDEGLEQQRVSGLTMLNEVWRVLESEE